MIGLSLSLPAAVVAFLASTAVIAFAGTRMSGTADRIADRTGLGEAVTGAVLLGAATSLSGITASVTAAAYDLPTLALANAIGGIAAQTVFLAFADLAYRQVNLEHAAASVPNMMQAALLMVLLGLMLCAMIAPPLSVLGVHPISPILIVVYLFGLRMVQTARDEPMWQPRVTRQTRVDEPEEPAGGPMSRVWLEFAGLGALVLVAGVLMARSGGIIAEQTGLSQTLVGGLFIAVATSLPELVTSIAAVRRGALTLAVAGVIGGNAFDTLFAAVADAVYRGGSLYHSATSREMLLIALTVVMTAVLLLGLLRRERSGPGGIGFESCGVLVLYALGIAAMGLL